MLLGVGCYRGERIEVSYILMENLMVSFLRIMMDNGALDKKREWDC